MAINLASVCIYRLPLPVFAGSLQSHVSGGKLCVVSRTSLIAKLQLPSSQCGNILLADSQLDLIWCLRAARGLYCDDVM